MSKLEKHIWIGKHFPRETFLFLMECEGISTASKMLTKIVTDYNDMKYRLKELERENKLLEQRLKTIEK